MNNSVPLIKICGITERSSVDLCIESRVEMLGFVFYKPSPRSLTIKKASALMTDIPSETRKVALIVDASDNLIEQIMTNLPIDILQLHGSESPSRVDQIKNRFKVPIIKCIPISCMEDFTASKSYEHNTDYLMFDSKPSKDASRPGGNAKSFDWSLLSKFKTKLPCILAGGLNVSNVKKAIKTSRVSAVDVSSGVESNLGKKDHNKIINFINAVRCC